MSTGSVFELIQRVDHVADGLVSRGMDEGMVAIVARAALVRREARNRLLSLEKEKASGQDGVYRAARRGREIRVAEPARLHSIKNDIRLAKCRLEKAERHLHRLVAELHTYFR